MKIAVGTDDGKTVREGRFCKSRHFMVIEILNAEIAEQSLMDNPHAIIGKETEEGEGKIVSVMQLLKDCSLYMGRRFDEYALEATAAQGIDCISTHYNEIDDAVCFYLDGKLEKFSYYSPDAKEHLPCAQRLYR